MIKIQNLTKKFITPRGKITVFDDFSLTVEDGAFLGIVGKSGAGKSTLISMIAGLQRPDSGKILISRAGEKESLPVDIFSLSDKELSAFRNERIGFVSQEQSFLENLTVLDNVRLPYFLGRKSVSKEENGFVTTRAMELLQSLEIAHLAKSYPRELSGGENHRVLIARAMINNPDIILADEPTESVDHKLTEQIVRIFRNLSDGGKTVILVSHDQNAVKYCDNVLEVGEK